MEHRADQDQIRHLEARYSHLDQRVGTISEDLSSMKATLGGVVDTLNRVANDLKPQPASVTAWLGVALVVAGMLGSTAWGVQQYVGMQLNPVQDRITELREGVVTNKEFRHQMHFEIGKLQHTDKVHDEKLYHYDELMHKSDDRVNELEKQAAAAEVSRRSIGDYAKELGLKGLRGRMDE